MKQNHNVKWEVFECLIANNLNFLFSFQIISLVCFLGKAGYSNSNSNLDYFEEKSTYPRMDLDHQSSESQRNLDSSEGVNQLRHRDRQSNQLGTYIYNLQIFSIFRFIKYGL